MLPSRSNAKKKSSRFTLKRFRMELRPLRYEMGIRLINFSLAIKFLILDCVWCIKSTTLIPTSNGADLRRVKFTARAKSVRRGGGEDLRNGDY